MANMVVSANLQSSCVKDVNRESVHGSDRDTGVVTNTRPQRNTGPPERYSPEADRGARKPYHLDRTKALAKKEAALDRPYTPEVTFKEGTLVMTFQGMVFEAFKQKSFELDRKEGYSVVIPKSSNKLTADGSADSNSLEVKVNGRKVYAMNFFNTTSRVTVNGQKMKSLFVEEDLQYILDSISGAGITNRHIYLLTNAAREAIGKAKLLPTCHRLEIEGSIPVSQPVSEPVASLQTSASTVNLQQVQVGTNPTQPTTQPMFATNHIPLPHHSTNAIVGPAPRLPPSTAVVTSSTSSSTTSAVTTTASITPGVKVSASVSGTIRPMSSGTPGTVIAATGQGPTLVLRLPGNFNNYPLHGGRSPLLNPQSQPTASPNIPQVQNPTSSPADMPQSAAATNSTHTTPPVSSSGPSGASAASLAGTKARAELNQLEKVKKELKEKQREMEDVVAQAAKSKAIALDLEAQLKDARESLRIRDLLDAKNQEYSVRGRTSRKSNGIDGNWRDACRSNKERSNPPSRYRGQPDRRRNDSRASDRSYERRSPSRSRHSSRHSSRSDRSYRSHRRDKSPYRERSVSSRGHAHHCCCNHRRPCEGDGGMENRMARLEARLNEYRMDELERRLKAVEGRNYQKGRYRRRQRHRVTEGPKSSEKYSQPKPDAPNSNASQLDSDSHLESSVLNNPSPQRETTDSPDQQPGKPLTSSPVPRGPLLPHPPFRVSDDAEIEEREVTTSSETVSFLDQTIRANRSR